ncbi:reverse transcriptase domain, reverse transcriptase zinc-binding domain protein [Tanacetum coccineum]
MEVINLCFADDLFLFAHGDVQSAKIIMESLDEFKLVSGLTPSLPKSTAYFCNVLNHIKLAILQVLPFEEGRLPVKYLGVLLVPSRLVYNDCKELIEKVEGRINEWKNKSLSIAGRLQLVQSVIASMHVYWVSDVVYLPKDEGGLGVRRLDFFNKALMSFHIWKLLSRNDSLWVEWIHFHKIKNRNFWDISCRADVLGSGSLVWPHELGIKYPILLSIPSPQLSQGVHDKLEWRSRLGSIKPFVVNTVWQAIRPRDIKVAWVDAVWFPNCIPRHAFNLWLIIRKKLKTQDSLRSWDISSSLDYSCPLCESQPDSHEHLFFACPFSSQVWFHMRDMEGLSHLPPSIDVILDDIVPMANRRTSKSVISKLVLSASAYFIWLERNDRLFTGNKRTAAQVIDCVMSAIRLKLMSCRFKKSKVGLDLMQRWKLPEVLLI